MTLRYAGHDRDEATKGAVLALIKYPWAGDVNGNDLYWLADDGRKPWPIIARAGYDFQRIDLPMTAFLARAMKREIECILWKQEGFFPDP